MGNFVITVPIGWEIQLKKEAREDPEAFIKRMINDTDPNNAGPYGIAVINGFKNYLASGANDIFPDELLEKYFPMRCPKNGAFFAYKKANKKARTVIDYNDVFRGRGCESLIVTLLIPKDAKRSSGFGDKCRASEAEVMDIEFAYPKDYEGEEPPTKAASKYCPPYCTPIIYEVGKTVVSDFFDDNRWREYSSGIHFFMTKEEALNY